MKGALIDLQYIITMAKKKGEGPKDVCGETSDAWSGPDTTVSLQVCQSLGLGLGLGLGLT